MPLVGTTCYCGNATLFFCTLNNSRGDGDKASPVQLFPKDLSRSEVDLGLWLTEKKNLCKTCMRIPYRTSGLHRPTVRSDIETSPWGIEDCPRKVVKLLALRYTSLRQTLKKDLPNLNSVSVVQEVEHRCWTDGWESAKHVRYRAERSA